MSNMHGNPHHKLAEHRLEGVHEWQSEEGSTDATNIATAIDAQTSATLALAYEQRTANLIAIHSRGSIDLTDFSEKHRDDWFQMARDIGARLGIRQEDTK